MPRQRPAIALLFAITATAIMGNPLIAPVVPDILADLQASRSMAGWIIGATTLPGIVLAPVIGALADRYGRRSVIAPCLLLFGVAGSLCMTATSIEMLLLFRLLQGVGLAGLVNLAIVLIADHWSGTERAAMVGRNSAVLTVCLTAYPLLGGALGDLGGWQLSFAPFLLAPLTAVLIWRRLPPDRPDSDVRVFQGIGRALPALRSPQLLTVLAGGLVVFMLVFGVMLTVLPLYLEEVFDLPATLRGLVMGLPAVATTVAALSLGRLRAGWSHRVVLIAGGGLLVTGLVGLALSTTVVAVVASVMFFGLGEGLTIPTLQERAASAGEAGQRGTIVALFVSASRIGQTAGPALLSWLAAGAGAPTAFAAAAGGAAVIALLFVMTPAEARRGPPTGHRLRR